MIAAATMPRPGAAKGVVPKNGIGVAFGIDGVPGSADMVKVEVPSTIAAGISRPGTPAARNSVCAIGASTNKATNNAAVSDGGAGEHHCEHRAALAELLGHEA